MTDRTHRAAVTAANTLDAYDEELTRLFDEVSRSMSRYANALARRKLPPDIVLGQMLQVPCAVFVYHLLPSLLLGGNDGE